MSFSNFNYLYRLLFFHMNFMVRFLRPLRKFTWTFFFFGIVLNLYFNSGKLQNLCNINLSHVKYGLSSFFHLISVVVLLNS